MSEALIRYALSFFVIFSLASLAAMICERSGVINLGIEGFMIIGCMIYALLPKALAIINVDYDSYWIIIFIASIILAMLGTFLFSLLHSFIVLKLKTDQIVSGTVINLLAQGIGFFLVGVENLGSSGNIQGTISPILQETPAVSIYFIITLIFITGLFGYFKFTKTGTRHIAAGENPNALDTAGVSVNKYRFIAISVSSCLAGLAGIIYTINIKVQFAVPDVNGIGFISLAIMVIGQWKVLLIVFVSFVFSIFFTIGKMINIPNFTFGLAPLLPFLMSLVVMVIASKWSIAPKEAGIPFDKTLR
ncbi:ABC transporter permease [Mesoplasma corruscae]|uniref:Ribose/galactose ABC transporter permease n=1 Tax=Mesoplasma corruscae TaxID=216874 RepID=A0A2S5RFU7_9MOLU|nr:ABC transporter permease [Mesoplasma corruscae]PPE06204.1 ribose/galactose ABC transporter permease [Mesoplasma corruscae]